MSCVPQALSYCHQRRKDCSDERDPLCGSDLSVNNNRSAPPYEIKAIGNPNNLESALKLRGGVLENFKFWGIQADLSQSDDIVIPAFKGRKVLSMPK